MARQGVGKIAASNCAEVDVDERREDTGTASTPAVVEGIATVEHAIRLRELCGRREVYP
jgi:hypothetical protein